MCSLTAAPVRGDVQPIGCAARGTQRGLGGWGWGGAASGGAGVPRWRWLRAAPLLDIGYARPVTGLRCGRPRHGQCFLIKLSLSLSLSLSLNPQPKGAEERTCHMDRGTWVGR